MWYSFWEVDYLQQDICQSKFGHNTMQWKKRCISIHSRTWIEWMWKGKKKCKRNNITFYTLNDWMLEKGREKWWSWKEKKNTQQEKRLTTTRFELKSHLPFDEIRWKKKNWTIFFVEWNRQLCLWFKLSRHFASLSTMQFKWFGS